MKVVILGAGVVGTQLAKQLIEEKKSVVVIEKDPDKVRLASKNLDCMVIQDEGNDIEVLRKAGIKDADYFIALTDSDEVNMIACRLASSEFSGLQTIARVRNDVYTPLIHSEKSILGIDHIINPQIEAVKTIIQNIHHGVIGNTIFFEEEDFQLRVMYISATSAVNGLTVEELRKRFAKDFIVVAILRDNSYIIPTGSTQIEPDDDLYLFGTEQDLDDIFAFEGTHKVVIRKIVISGGGFIGTSVAEYLLNRHTNTKQIMGRLFKAFPSKNKKQVVIIEKSIDVCKRLSEQFPDALIIHADISDEGVMEEGQLSDYDLLIAVDDNQELNLVTAMYAKALGIKKTIALVIKNNYVNIASSFDIDVTISLKNNIVNTILKLIRKGTIKSIHSVLQGELEVLELAVEKGSRADGRKIKEIGLPNQCLIMFLSRNKQGMIPDGECVVMEGDLLGIVTDSESIPKIEKIFSNQS